MALTVRKSSHNILGECYWAGACRTRRPLIGIKAQDQRFFLGGRCLQTQSRPLVGLELSRFSAAPGARLPVMIAASVLFAVLLLTQPIVGRLLGVGLLILYVYVYLAQ